jgi:cell division protein FtsL
VIRLNLVLVLAVIGSAMLLVRTQYESRRLFDLNEKAALESRRLATERERLTLEQRAHSVPLRVERLAKEQLSMRAATPGMTHYVRGSSAQALASASAPNSGAQQ